MRVCVRLLVLLHACACVFARVYWCVLICVYTVFIFCECLQVSRSCAERGRAVPQTRPSHAAHVPGRTTTTTTTAPSLPPLSRFLRQVEQGYRDNPYHNKVHAADVVQSMHIILKRGGLVPGYADPLTHLACLLAAVRALCARMCSSCVRVRACVGAWEVACTHTCVRVPRRACPKSPGT